MITFLFLIFFFALIGFLFWIFCKFIGVMAKITFTVLGVSLSLLTLLFIVLGVIIVFCSLVLLIIP